MNTPRLITDANGNAVWQWDNAEPFGNSIPNQSPNGTGTQFVFNLRFAGQYFDQETGTHYNYFRDYDPVTGRYLESDPIGLDGGQLSTYAYVGNRPLVEYDKNGLQGALTVPEVVVIGLIGYGWWTSTHNTPPSTPPSGSVDPETQSSSTSNGTLPDWLRNTTQGPMANGTGVPEQSWPTYPPENNRPSGGNNDKRDKCYAAYTVQIRICKMSPTEKARAQCYASAANVLGECLKTCK